MANIHEQLYQSHSFSNLSFDEGLKNLVTTILENMDYEVKIKTRLDLEPIELNINQAVPCSLIVNEVITNSIKHAFNDYSNGFIAIELHNRDNELTLKIMDNGVGFPDSKVGASQNGSLGMELIQTLTLQLEGEYSYRSRDNAPGAFFQLNFRVSDSPGSSSS